MHECSWTVVVLCLDSCNSTGILYTNNIDSLPLNLMSIMPKTCPGKPDLKSLMNSNNCHHSLSMCVHVSSCHPTLNRMSLALRKGCPDPVLLSLILSQKAVFIDSFGHFGSRRTSCRHNNDISLVKLTLSTRHGHTFGVIFLIHL